MSQEETFVAVKSYLENDPIALKALAPLSPGVEIGLIIGGVVHCAICRTVDGILVEQRSAQNPDVEFSIKPETVYVLRNEKAQDVPAFALAMLKEVLAGHIHFKFTGPMLNLTSKGYLNVLKEGGQKFKDSMAQMGLTGMAKAFDMYQKLKSK